MAETNEPVRNSGEPYDKRCGHGGCACLMQEDEEFCSDACEAAAGDGDSCDCGHLACTSHAA
jgi:hypothetical protein